MLDDIEVLRQHNDSAKRYRQLRATQIGRLIKQSPAQAILEAEHSYQGYLHLRAVASAARIRALLENPVGTLGEDPFTDDRYWDPLGSCLHREVAAADRVDAWPQERRAELERLLTEVLYAPPPWPVKGPMTQDLRQIHLLGVPALLRVVGTLIGIIKELERQDTSSDLLEPLGAAQGTVARRPGRHRPALPPEQPVLAGVYLPPVSSLSSLHHGCRRRSRPGKGSSAISGVEATIPVST